MKSLVLLLLSFFFINVSVQGQIGISSTQWQQDLRSLQKAVHEDYPFLFKKVTADEFDQAVEQLHQSIPDMEEHQVVTGLARIVAMFKYGHTSLRLRGSDFVYHQLPWNLYQFHDGVYVEGIHRDYRELLGGRLLAVEGVPVEKALEKVRPVVPAENDQYFKAHGLIYLGIPEVLHAQGVMPELKHKIEVTLEIGGTQKTHTVQAGRGSAPRRYGFIRPGSDWLTMRDTEFAPLYLKDLDRIYFFEHLPDQKTVYVRHSQIQDDSREAIPEFYERVFKFIDENEVERLILDLRLNGGGNNYKNKPIVTGIIESKKINRPGRFFVILGRRTFSACQNLVNELDNYTNVIFVGEPTSENINFYGDNRKVQLPNSKLDVFLSFAWWQDKPQWENGPWTAPHLAVELNSQDYRQNHDPVLDAALKFSDDDFILDPMQHLTQLFMAGKLDQVKTDARQLVDDPRYRFFNFESQFNRAGYKLLESGRATEAVFVFQLNTELYPQSPNAFDSLAEAHWKNDEIEQAKKFYGKAIQMDPDGEIGAHAREMLTKIDGKKSD